MTPLRRSPLHTFHQRLEAKLVPFGGWEMPIAYPTGTLAEHRACREHAALFDVSHLGTVRLTGTDAFGVIQDSLTNDLAKITPGRAQYTHLLNDAGGVEDDIIVWWLDDETFDVMPNASNTDRVVAAIGGIDVTETRAIVAVQGPRARDVVATVSDDAARVERFSVRSVRIGDVDCTVAGTGYTGEDGVEISVPAESAGRLWEALVAGGGLPAGLGARDTLRLEAALPLHGHELSPTITPLEAGLGWVVAWNKPRFIGRESLQAQRTNGVTRRLRGIVLEGRRPARADAQVQDPDGRVLGTVTSGNFSPVLETAIALALVDAKCEIGDSVQIESRGDALPGTVVKTPFV